MREKLIKGLILGGLFLFVIGAVIFNWYLFPTPKIKYIDPDNLGSVPWQSIDSQIWDIGPGRPPGIQWKVWDERVYAVPSASESGLEIHWSPSILPYTIGLSSGHPIGFQLRDETQVFKVERKGDKLFVYVSK